MRKKIKCIYRITNQRNNKFYIGSTVYFASRKSSHLRAFRKGKHQDYFQKAYDKYGEKEFIFEILEVVQDEHKLIEREQYYLDLLKPYIRTIGYNIAKIAGSQLGFRHSDKTKELLRKQQLGKSYEDKVGAEKAKEWIEKTRKSNTGKKRTPEMIEKMTKNNGSRGRKHTIEERQKMREKKLGKNPPNKGRIILQYDLSNNFIQEIELHDAQIILKIQKSNIVKCCVGERKTAGGFIWKYKEKKK